MRKSIISRYDHYPEENRGVAGHVAMMMDFGCMGRDKTQASVGLFAERVSPALNGG